MTITAAMAAALAVLTEALDDPGADIARSLQGLALDAAAAVPSYLGLSVVVSHSDPQFTVTVLTEGAVAGDVRSSLRVALLPGVGEGQGPAPVALVLYAGVPGSFVDLAADLVWLTGRSSIDVTLDEHLTLAGVPDTAAQLRAAMEIDQAIGVLIGRGYTLRQAHRQLDIQAANNRTDRHTQARLILDGAIDAGQDQLADRPCPPESP